MVPAPQQRLDYCQPHILLGTRQSMQGLKVQSRDDCQPRILLAQGRVCRASKCEAETTASPASRLALDLEAQWLACTAWL